MSNDNSGAAGSASGVPPSKRIGTADRERAIALLEQHWHAGRLDPAEHELRVTRAKAAVTQADLDAIFADLPQAGAGPEPAGAGQGREAAGPGGGQEPTGTVDTAGSGGFLESNRDTIIALTPFIALVLFFATRLWMWFLLVPVMGILLYGPGGRRNPRQRRR